MTELVEILRENVGKQNHEMRRFFQQMVTDGRLKAYNVVRATLTPVRELKENQQFFIEDLKTGEWYSLETKTEGGTFSEQGSQTIYNYCVVEKIKQGIIERRLKDMTSSDYNLIDSNVQDEEVITGRIVVKYDEYWRATEEYDYI